GSACPTRWPAPFIPTTTTYSPGRWSANHPQGAWRTTCSTGSGSGCLKWP
ncbi:uncharacterized protein METZ01_LOCUS485599, partial [marine metagenome]